ncbi:MAG: hypothetical protein EKK62_17040 [Acidimicrobiia bacterium]|nr:MAG: hypothetical protein EKK62_17040 [Acidimicrobiia bacterium]
MAQEERGRVKRPARGSYRIRRDLRRIGLGMLQISAHTTNQREYERRNAVVGKLIDDAQVDVLRALQAGRVTIEQLVDLDRRNEMRGSQIMGTVAMKRSLWEAWEEMAETAGRKPETGKRYLVSMRQLQALLPASANVGELLVTDWARLSKEWARSPSDWNHVRRAVSRLLSVVLGDKYHPMRREIVARIPILKENQRVPDLSPAVFWRIVGHAREDVRPVFVALVATGLRVRTEFLRMDATNLLPATKQLRVPEEGKTGQRTVSVPAEAWEYVKAAIPSPLQYKRLRALWQAACKAAGVDGVVLHDLRHAHAQWATDMGAQLTQVQQQMGHSTPLMTARYARQRDAKASASAVGRALRKRG